MSAPLITNSASHALTAIIGLYQFGPRDCLVVPQQVALPTSARGVHEVLLRNGKLTDDVEASCNASTYLIDQAGTIVDQVGPTDLHPPLLPAARDSPEQRHPYLTRYTRPTSNGEPLESLQVELQLAERRRLRKTSTFFNHGRGLQLSRRIGGSTDEFEIGLRLDGFRAYVSQREQVIIHGQDWDMVDHCTIGFAQRSDLARLLSQTITPHDQGSDLQLMHSLKRLMRDSDPDLFFEGFLIEQAGRVVHQPTPHSPYRLYSIAGLPTGDHLFEIDWSENNVQLSFSRPQAQWFTSGAIETFAGLFDAATRRIQEELVTLDRFDPAARHARLLSESGSRSGNWGQLRRDADERLH